MDEAHGHRDEGGRPAVLRNWAPPLPVAEEGGAQFVQRSENARKSVSPQRFPGTANRQQASGIRNQGMRAQSGFVSLRGAQQRGNPFRPSPNALSVTGDDLYPVSKSRHSCHAAMRPSHGVTVGDGVQPVAGPITLGPQPGKREGTRPSPTSSTQGYPAPGHVNPMIVVALGGIAVRIEQHKEGNTMDMDTLGYFIFMEEQEKKAQQQEDGDDEDEED